MLDDAFSVCSWSKWETALTIALSGARLERGAFRYTSEAEPLEPISW